MAFGRGLEARRGAELLDILPSLRLQPDRISFGAAVAACRPSGDWQLALCLLFGWASLPNAEAAGLSASAFNAALPMLTWPQALSLTESMLQHAVQPDLVSKNSLLLAMEGDTEASAVAPWQLTMLQVSGMRQVALRPDAFTLTAAIGALGAGLQAYRALELMSLMRHERMPPSLVATNALMGAMERASHWERALEVLGGASAQGLRPDLVSYCSAASACDKSRRWQLASGLLEGLCRCRLRANAVSFNTLISNFQKNERWPASIHALVSMSFSGVAPTLLSVNAAISSLGCARHWQLALSYLPAMRWRKLSPDLVSFSAAMSACEQSAKWPHSLLLLCQVAQQALRPSQTLCDVLLSSCAKAAAWSEALELLLGRVGGVDVEPGAAALSSASEACEIRRRPGPVPSLCRALAAHASQELEATCRKPQLRQKGAT
ncbi:unnamed protein product, partial [Polarella glacialis]